MAKHRNGKTVGAVKKAGLMGTVALSATALTMGLTAPAAGAAAIGSSQQEVALSALEDLFAGAGDINGQTFAEALAPLYEQLGIQVPDLFGSLIPSAFPLPGGGDLNLPVKVITTGPPFGALGILGLNPTWVPAIPSRLADAINSTPYGGIDTSISQPLPDAVYNGARALAYATAAAAKTQELTTLANTPKAAGGGGCAAGSAGNLCRTLFLAQRASQITAAGEAARNAVPRNIDVPLQLANLRIPIVIAFGLGSLATGMAYPDAVADLPNQPGGANDPTPTAGEGSLTILTMILLRNPGRADGGIAARFAPILDPILGALGQNSVVTPDGQVEHSGGAILVPVKVDGTVEYDPLSDFAAWPNPFALANNGAAFLFPTYILRGADIESALPLLLAPVLGGIGGNVLSGIIGDGINVPTGLPAPFNNLPLSRAALVPVLSQLVGVPVPVGDPNDPTSWYTAINSYFTLHSDAIPLLEPFRYPTDFANLFTGGAFGFTNPFADAIEPALKILVNLGYTNVTQDMSNPLDPYPRDFTGNYGSEFAPFFTFPENIDWGQVPADVFTALLAGTQDAFFSGGIPGVHPGANIANPLAMILSLLGLGGGGLPGLGGIPDLGGLLDGIPGFGDFLGGGLGLPTGTMSTLAAPAGGAVADSNDPLTRLGAVLANTLYEAFDRQAPVPSTASTGPVDSAADVIEGLGASGLRLLASAVLGPTRLAALAEGGPDALADLIENSVDAPLWIADPLLYGLRDAAPEGLRDGITDFRDNIWRLTEQINDALLGALDDLPGAPADTQVTAGNAKQQSPQVQGTLRAAGTLPQQAPPTDGQKITVDVPPADPVITPNDDEEEIVVEKETTKTTQNPNRIAGQVSKGIERVGERVHEAITDTVKALTPKKPAPAPTSSTTGTEG